MTDASFPSRRTILSCLAWVTLVSLAAQPPTARAGTADGTAAPDARVERFATDPISRPDAVVAGAALARLEHRVDAPAFRGDTPGSLRARYDSALPPGWFGLRLPRSFDQDDAFTVAAAFEIEPDGFYADPFGFFQISWGLWNTAVTGIERTGTPESFAADTFEALEFNYFPNVSPVFGGPYVGPSLFGEAAPDDPAFPFLGAFANASFVFGVERELPLGVPLLVVASHEPVSAEVIFRVWRLDGDTPRPLLDATTTVAIDALVEPAYTFDAIGPTLWKDGFGGGASSVRADVTYHALVALPGLVDLDDLLARVAPAAGTGRTSAGR